MPRQLTFDQDRWEGHLYWQNEDRRTLKRVNALIKDIQRGSPFEGVGKPEPLQHLLTGTWSRRIDETHRLVSLVTDTHVVILQARDRY